MKILALDTSFSACSVALFNDDIMDPLHQTKIYHQVAPMQHTKMILPMIQEMLHSSSIEPKELDAIAFGCGPGSFTGVRVASSIAQGMGFALNCPIMAVSSLAAAAQHAFTAYQWSNILVAIDAHMEKIYWATYQANSKGYVELKDQEKIILLDKLPKQPASELVSNDLLPSEKTDWYGVGDGWAKYSKQLLSSKHSKPRMIASSVIPTAEAVLDLAKIKWQEGDLLKPHEAIPNYLHSVFEK